MASDRSCLLTAAESIEVIQEIDGQLAAYPEAAKNDKSIFSVLAASGSAASCP